MPSTTRPSSRSGHRAEPKPTSAYPRERVFAPRPPRAAASPAWRLGAERHATALRSRSTSRRQRLPEPRLPEPARNPVDPPARLVAELRVEARRLEVVRVEHDQRAPTGARFRFGRREQIASETGTPMRRRDPRVLDLRVAAPREAREAGDHRAIVVAH